MKNRIINMVILLSIFFTFYFLTGCPPDPSPEPTKTPALTNTPTKVPEPTPGETPDPTQTSGETPEPTQTAGQTPEPTPGETPEPTQTSGDTPEPTPGETPDPTQTSGQTPDPTQTAGQTPEPTSVVTPEPTPGQTPEPTPEETPDPTQTAGQTPEPTPGETPEPTPTPVETPEPTSVVTPEPTPEETPDPTPSPTPDKWTIMVYLDADNNLETYGIEDFNEMEGVDFSGTGINVIVLMDRSPGYDTSNGNWTDTKLFEINYDPSGSTNLMIISTELASTELGLTTGNSEELNMGDPTVCSHFIDFCKNSYPANNYFLIYWNHGSGWKNSPGYIEKTFSGNIPLTFDKQIQQNRAVCFDDTSSDALYTKEIGDSIEGKGIMVVGFDACYASMIEVAYELRNDADYMIGSEEVEGADGWEYDFWLNSFKATGLSAIDLLTSVIDAYETKYASTAGTTLAGIDLSEIDGVMTALNDFSNALYNSISDASTQNLIAGTLYMDVESFYNTTTGDGDLNLDIWHMADVIYNEYDYADTEATALKAAVDSAVVDEWHHPYTGVTGNPDAHGIAIHFIIMDDGMPYAHDLAYCKGYSWAHPLEFVASSDWVITYPSGPGLLFRLWYETF